MTSNFVKEKKEVEVVHTIDGAQDLTDCVKQSETLAKHTRSKTALLFKDTEVQGLRRKSAHKVSIVHKKVKDQVNTLNSNKRNAFYFFKHNNTGSLISELESVCCAFCRLIATPTYVPSAKAIYDEKNQMIGVASKKLPFWESNHDNPLKWDDIVLDIPSFKLSLERNKLQSLLPLLIDELDRSGKNQQGLMSLSFVRIKNVINTHLNSTETAVNFVEELKKFQQHPCRFNLEVLDNLLKKLQARENHIINKIKSPQYKTELDLLSQTQQLVINLINMTSQEKNKNGTLIVEMEKIFKRIKENNFFILINNENKSIYDHSIEDAIYPDSMNDNNHQIRIKDIKNYMILRGLGTSLTTRYIAKEVDNHNSNMSKYGHIIDFDMTKFNILMKFKEMDFTTILLRTPEKNTFIVTERDILNFPNLKDANHYYWPTRQTFVSKSMVDLVSHVVDMSANFFSSQDNEVYKALAENPIFIFHKFKTLLKYVLTTKKMYYEIGKLNLRADATYIDNNQEKNILDEMVEDEVDRINDFRRILIKMPEFKNFLSNEGNYAFQLIEEEFAEYQNELKHKLPYKSHYQALHDTFDFSSLEERLDQLYVDAGAQKAALNTLTRVSTSP